MKLFNIILATDNNFIIGKELSLPWNFKMDLKHFSNLTKPNNIFSHKNVLIMGRKTWESLGCKNLENRINYVISSKDFSNCENTLFFRDFYSAYCQASEVKGDIWVIGGSKIYDTALRHWACDKIYWTHINGEFQGDVQFNINNYKIDWVDEVKYNDINTLDNKEYILTFKVGQIKKGVESQYLQTLHELIISGEERQTRNSITYSKFNKTISWDLEDGFPLITTKKVFWKGIVEELLFFIRGETDTTKLSNKGVKIWEPNTRREFLDNMGFKDYPVGEMGPMYGFQWRNFNGQGIDQLKKIINEIKSDPHSRRILMTDFNPAQAHLGVLYPCHSIILQFYIEKNRLSCNMYQRSQDVFLGECFNIASTSLLVHIIAKLTGYTAGKVSIIAGDYHLYQAHLEPAKLQLSRTPFNLPKILIKDFKNLEEVENSNLEDYKIIDYHCHTVIKAEMIA